MPFPPPLYEKLLRRFDELLDEARHLRETATRKRGRARIVSLRTGEVSSRDPDYHVVDYDAYVRWVTKAGTLMGQLLGEGHPQRGIVAEFQGASKPLLSSLRKLIARLEATRDDFSNGFLDDLALQVEANIASDYMAQAEHLLAEGRTGHWDHVPAAVLAGAVLEKSLRALCGEQVPPVATTNPNGKPIRLAGLVDGLKKAQVFNEAKAKQLRAWADIRNHAAHGEFTEFDRSDVDHMIQGVEVFLADYVG